MTKCKDVANMKKIILILDIAFIVLNVLYSFSYVPFMLTPPKYIWVLAWLVGLLAVMICVCTAIYLNVISKEKADTSGKLNAVRPTYLLIASVSFAALLGLFAATHKSLMIGKGVFSQGHYTAVFKPVIDTSGNYILQMLLVLLSVIAPLAIAYVAHIITIKAINSKN